MPNWCFNTVDLTFPHPILKDRFMEKFYGFRATYPDDVYFNLSIGRLLPIIDRKWHCFNSLYPVPREVLNRGFEKAGYDWQSNSWGTKWDIFLKKEEINQTDNTVSFAVETAWSPPTGVVNKIIELYPDAIITMRYDEPGMCFVGELNYDPITKTTEDVYYDEISGGKKYYDVLAKRSGCLEEYFGIEEEDQIRCTKCNSAINKRIYDAYDGKCYSCNNQILLRIANRSIVERISNK
jgi:hypothetical protein